MFKKTKEERPGLDQAINNALEELKSHDPDSVEYAKILDQLERLYKLQVPTPEPAKPLSMDTVLIVAGNLAGIVAVIGYERAHVITSKALGFIIKPR